MNIMPYIKMILDHIIFLVDIDLKALAYKDLQHSIKGEYILTMGNNLTKSGVWKIF